MNIYFIPGLGVDKKIFRHISVPEGCLPYYLDWIQPLKNETLTEYAYRMAENIDTSAPYVIVGLSFGGMLAAEIIKRYPNGTMILISSVPSSKDLPVYFKIAGVMELHRLIPVSILKSASLMKRLFTAETPEQKSYLKKAIREVDTKFVRWALNAILKWNGKISDTNYIHIHGSKDVVLPMMFCKPTHVIKGGGHLMVLTRAAEINTIISNRLRK